jgi:hypothetical protein
MGQVVFLPASVQTTEGNSTLGVALSGPLDRRARDEVLSARRPNHRSKLAKRTGAPSPPNSVSVQHASSNNGFTLSSIFRALLGRTQLAREPERSRSEPMRRGDCGVAACCASMATSASGGRSWSRPSRSGGKRRRRPGNHAPNSLSRSACTRASKPSRRPDIP